MELEKNVPEGGETPITSDDSQQQAENAVNEKTETEESAPNETTETLIKSTRPT